MMKSKMRKALMPISYIVAVIAFIGSIYFVEKALVGPSFGQADDYIYVTKDILTNDIPVIGSKQTIIKPYTDGNIKVVKSFYDYLAVKEQQENAIIYNDNTYMQNSGVDFGGVEKFDVISILDGTVIDVKEDNLLGKTIEIRHSNEMISVYQSLSEIDVKKDDTVIQGQIIGKSGVSNISKDLNDHLHFEFFYKGQVVNPLDYFDKKVEEL